MGPMKKRNFTLSALAVLATLAAPAARAQAYPTKPIRLVVPFPAGGATDIFARALSQKLGEKLGTTVVVDNKPGAGGTIGSDLAAKAAADGYTLLLATSSTHSIGPSFGKVPYDAVADFTPISHVGNAPSIMLVPNTSPAKTVKEWVDYARKNPGKLNYASSGNGTVVHLGTEYFKAQANLFLVHIPYRGTALAIPDLVSGKVDVLFDSLPSGLPHVKEGRLRALGITVAQALAVAAGPAGDIGQRCPASNLSPGSACTAPRACPPSWPRAWQWRQPGPAGPRRERAPGPPGHRPGWRHARAVCRHGQRRPRQVEKDHHRAQDHR
jgi:tripartite-type tricarboxylate transporter receptor subunit TctC